ncbi:hypothetical protein AB0B79_30365 [Streptomyces sp. NPDC039022]|uniref:hypothetical protein n=1 Tax=Streptomyces sp. NPDC039022 TaxID=3157091 RepID=UPI0033DB1B31
MTNPQKPRPITPTRIFPAGQSLPPAQQPTAAPAPPPSPAAAPPAPPMPPVPPTSMPPWWMGGPPQPPQGPLEIRVKVDLVPPEAEPESTRRERLWAWITSRISPYAAVLAMAAAVVPIPGIGYGLGACWGSYLYAMRVTVHPSLAYVVGLGAVAVCGWRITRRLDTGRRAQLLSLTGLSVSTVGVLYGVVRPLDIVTAITGVPA